MRRFLSSSMFGLGLVLLGLNAFALDSFDITFNNGTICSAGNSLTVTIRAMNGASTDTSYGGTASLAYSLAGTATPGTLSFVSGVATMPASGLTFYAAGQIVITIKDNGSSVQTAFPPITVLAQTAQRAIFLRHSSEIQEYLYPGAPGVCGYREVHGYVGVTLSSGFPVAVSVVAVDMYFNPVPGAETYTVSVAGTGNFFYPTANIGTGIAGFSWTPLASSPGQQNFILNDATPSLPNFPINTVNYIILPTECYLWTEAAPATLAANAPFFLTVTATTDSNRSSSRAIWVNYDFTLSPRQYYSLNTPGRGTLSSSILHLTNGIGNITLYYQAAETIEIVPTISDTSAVGKTFKTGGYAPINILPAAPASMFVAVTPANIQAQKTATLLVTVRDVYQNVVPGVVVNFEKIAGSADASVSPAQFTTDTNGVATATFRGGIINEIATIRMTVGAVSQTTDIRISVAPPSGGEMINYPNPFNPNNQKTSINYYLKDASKVEIRIYDAFGRVVLSRTLSPGEGSGDFFNATAAGGASFMWDGRNGEGHMVGNGIYTVKVTARNSVEMQKFTRRVGVLK